MRRAALLCLLVGCHRAPTTTREPAVANVAPPEAEACPDPALDAKARSPQAEQDGTLDPDGDGQDDPVFADCGFDFECDFLLYACGVYLGTIRGAGDAGPSCVEPGNAGTPCRLSIGVRMIHGETQEYFYEYVDGAYEQTGAGELSPADPY